MIELCLNFCMAFCISIIRLYQNKSIKKQFYFNHLKAVPKHFTKFIRKQLFGNPFFIDLQAEPASVLKRDSSPGVFL